MEVVTALARKLCENGVCGFPAGYIVLRTIYYYIVASCIFMICRLCTGNRSFGGIEAYITYVLFWSVFIGMLGGMFRMLTINSESEKGK